MKKLFKRKEEETDITPDNLNILTLLQSIKQQLVFLEKKIDALASQPQERQHEHYSHGQGGHDRGFKAICAECGQPCEVPFKPQGGRPVYCRDCFSKREGGSFEGRRDSRPRSGGYNREHRGGRHLGNHPSPFRGKKRF